MRSRVPTMSKTLLMSTVLGLGLSAFAFGAQAHDDCDRTSGHRRAHHHHHHHGSAMRGHDGKVRAYKADSMTRRHKKHVHRAKMEGGMKGQAKTQDQMGTKDQGQMKGGAQGQMKGGAAGDAKGKSEMKK